MPVMDFSHLSHEERLQLVDELLESLEPEEVPLTEAQTAELKRRLELVESGRMEMIPWEQVQADLKRRYG